MTVLPTNLQTVIMKNAGHVVPNELLQLIISKKPNVFGFAVQGKDEKGGAELSIGHEEGTPEMADLEDFQRNAVDFRAMLTFGWLTEGFNKEDILPLVLYGDGDNNAYIALGLEGDFPKHDTNNGRTQEQNLAMEIILPTLAEICELVDGDIPKLLAALGKPSFNNNFLSQIGHRGILNILPFEGEPLFFGKNTLGGEPFDWGQTSQLHGFGDAKQEPVVEAPKKRFSFGKKTAAVEPPAVPKDVATPGTAPRASVPAVKTEVKKHEGPDPVKVPEWVHSNDDKRDFYLMVMGGIPKEWKRRIPVIPAVGATVPNSLVDLNAWRANRKKAAIAASSVVKPVETATSAGSPKTGTDIKTIKAQENLPIIDAKEMEGLLNFVAKHLDGQSVEMTKPSEIQAIEKKFPALSEALGMKPQELLNWPVSGLFALGKHDYRAIVLGFIEMRNLWRNTLKVEDLVDTAPKVTTTETKIGDTGKKVESVSNEAAPVKKKMFSFGKKAA